MIWLDVTFQVLDVSANCLKWSLEKCHFEIAENIRGFIGSEDVLWRYGNQFILMANEYNYVPPIFSDALKIISLQYKNDINETNDLALFIEYVLLWKQINFFLFIF